MLQLLRQIAPDFRMRIRQIPKMIENQPARTAIPSDQSGELAVDIVKIDGGFIQNLASSAEDQLFVKALTDVAKGLGKITVAEFVENAETLTLLEKFGVDYAQGYHIGRPAVGHGAHKAHAHLPVTEGLVTLGFLGAFVLVFAWALGFAKA